MKNKFLIVALAAASISIVACNNGGKSNSGNLKDTTGSTTHASIKDTTAKTAVDAKTTASVKVLINDYLQLKNALAKDNSNDAAAAGKSMSADFGKFDQGVLTADQKKSYTDIADDAKESAEHIGKSGGNIPHQREHFDMLSKDMYDLVKLFGAGQPLYVDHCPMYNNKKGAIWLSETAAIKNPYLGLGMPTCGTIKEQLK